MDKHLRDRWTAALRSGRYRQGHGQLCDYTEHGKPRYCCLGVLGKVAGLLRKRGFEGVIDEDAGTIPTAVCRDIGLPVRARGALVGMNDTDGKTFKQIADWIEDNVPC